MTEEKPYKEQYRKDRRNGEIGGVIATIIVHLLILLFMLFFGLTHITDPDEEEEGLTCNYGTSADGSGMFEPAPQEAIADQLVDEAPSVPTSAPSEPAVSSKADLATQDIEEAPEVTAAKKKAKEEAEAKAKAEAQAKAEAKAKAEAEAKAKAEAEAKAKAEAERKAAITKKAQSAANAFSGSGTGGTGTSTSSTGQGTGSNPFGNQGSSTGGNGSGSGSGSGNGNGTGAGYSLNGRSIVGSLPKPNDNSNLSGKIVVAIEVDSSGNVISAKAGAQGTTIGDATLRRQAENAAMKAKFSGITDKVTQSGTITYIFTVN